MSIDDLVKEYNSQQKSEKHFDVNITSMDIRKLNEIDRVDYINALNDNYRFCHVEEALEKYIRYLVKHGIPFNRIEVFGTPHLSINGSKYQEIMQGIIRDNDDKLYGWIHNPSRFKHYTFSDIKDANYRASSYLKDVNIADTSNVLNLSLEFKALLYDDYMGKEVDPFDNLGLLQADKIRTFDELINFESFIKGLQIDGYELSMGKEEAIPITSYEEYFNALMANFNVNKDSKIYMKLDFRQKNNK